jgi:hypothetical protein
MMPLLAEEHNIYRLCHTSLSVKYYITKNITKNNKINNIHTGAEYLIYEST